MSAWEAGGVMGYFYEVLWWEFSDWSPIPIITASRSFELCQSAMSPLIHLLYLCSLRHKGEMDALCITIYKSMGGHQLVSDPLQPWILWVLPQMLFTFIKSQCDMESVRHRQICEKVSVVKKERRERFGLRWEWSGYEDSLASNLLKT